MFMSTTTRGLEMKDYASMSDFEINCRVHAEVMEISGLDSFKAKDYCNNPADAWPIITENRISIIHLDDNEWGCRGDGDKSSCRAINSNALRCAMIVFLMMKEDE